MIKTSECKFNVEEEQKQTNEQIWNKKKTIKNEEEQNVLQYDYNQMQLSMCKASNNTSPMNTLPSTHQQDDKRDNNHNKNTVC